MNIEAAQKNMNVSDDLLTELYAWKEDHEIFHGILVQHIEDMMTCYALEEDDWTQEMYISLSECIATYVCYDDALKDMETFKKAFFEATRYEFLVEIAHRLRERNEMHMKDPECDKAIDMTLNAAGYAVEYFDDMFDDEVFKLKATDFMIGYLHACVFETGKV